MSHSSPRFTIRSLLGLTAIVAAATAALVNASATLAGVVGLAAYAALLVTVLAAAFAGEWARAVGLGFAVFGLGYRALLRCWDADGFVQLGTTQALYVVQEWIEPEPLGNSLLAAPLRYPLAMIDVGQILWTLLLAVCGAAWGWWNWRRKTRSPSPSGLRFIGRAAWITAWCAAFVALAYAAATATAATAGIAACLLAVVLMAAVVTACVNGGRRRAIAAGVAIGGLTYACLLGVVLDDETMDRRLGTTQLLMAVHSHIARDAPSPYPGRGMPLFPNPSFDRFIATGQSLWTLAFALVGGIAGGRFHRAQERRQAARKEPG